MVAISVIVPVYNVEKYINKFMDSLINQTFKDIEIICVFRPKNDNIFDPTINILNEYAVKDCRVKIIGQTMKGLSAARNSGYKIAQGDFIYYADSDDWLELNLLESVYNRINETNADIVLFGANNIYKNSVIKNNRRIKHFIKKYKQDTVMYNDNKSVIYQNCTAWTKFFRKKFIDDNNLSFVEHAFYAEDAIFWTTLMNYNPKITLMEDCLYNYLVNRIDSLTLDQARKNAILEQKKAYLIMQNSMHYSNFTDENKLYALDYYTMTMISLYSNFSSLQDLFAYEKELKDIINEYKNYKDLQLNFWQLDGYKLLKLRFFYAIGKKIIFNIVKTKNKTERY